MWSNVFVIEDENTSQVHCKCCNTFSLVYVMVMIIVHVQVEAIHCFGFISILICSGLSDGVKHEVFCGCTCLLLSGQIS